MIVEFPRLVFKNHGPHSRQGGSYSSLLTQNKKEYEAALEAGWYSTLPEAIKSQVVNEQTLPVVESNSERQSLEQQAKALKIRFHPAVSDQVLQERVNQIISMRSQHVVDQTAID